MEEHGRIEMMGERGDRMERAGGRRERTESPPVPVQWHEEDGEREMEYMA